MRQILCQLLWAKFVGNLSQLEKVFPSRESVDLYGDGNVKAIFLDEDDVTRYRIKTIDDPVNCEQDCVYAAAREHPFQEWENLIRKELHKRTISAQDFLSLIPEKEFMEQVAVGRLYHILYKGCLSNFEIGEGPEEASMLYPEVNHTRVRDHIKSYL